MAATVFDFDGVIADSEPAHEAALREAVRPLGITFDHDRFARDFIGTSDRACIRALLADASVQDDEDTVERIVRHKADLFLDALAAGNIRLYPDIDRVIQTAAELGPVGVCSGSGGTVVEAVLERFGLLPRFDAVVTADRVRAPKPDPEGYTLCAALLGAEPARCTAIEDSPPGIRAARAAGLRVYAVLHTHEATMLTQAHAQFERVGEIGAEDLAPVP